ncbi:glutamine synthetase family protein [Paradesertivirga mongoliensis]|uniref:Glutamine synthetase family protein n=1 Tax=Paradesertivirga mongoliensis TaxID=2100740 RepID=A0ABW4ZN21_9SPHI|nr:glutamine synthetase family protein [Pedobacter mongoliensis]
MDKVQIIKYLDDNKIERIKFAFADIDGVLRGKVIHRKKFLEGLESGYGFCDVVFGWDSADVLYDNSKITGWHSGYPDQLCSIDLSTFRTIPWQDGLPFFLADFSNSVSAHAACPRTLLKRMAADCNALGFHPEFAQEFEWFNFKETPQSLEEKEYVRIQPISPGMHGYSIIRPSLYNDYNDDLFTLLRKFDVPIEALHTETGPGVYEAAIQHDDVLQSADQAVLLKTSVKEISYKHGMMASFMAKWNGSLPGCSGHIHQSLWDKKEGKNQFFNPADPDKMSDIMKQYLAGQLHCLPHILPMYAPTVNSYKRLVEGAWAPTTVTWGIENRTTAIRVINTSDKYTRIETRVPGSDTNPYLAMAAALASGLYGIKNKLSLDSPGTVGNAYANKEHKNLPSNLFEATTAMKDSDIATNLFGDDFVQHFCNTRLWEWRQFSKHVSDWELKRYFEII